MQKWIMSALLVVASALGVYLLAYGLPEKPEDPSSSLAEGQELLAIEATNFEFNEKEFRVKAGTNYRITLTNKLGNHGVEIAGLNVEIAPGRPVDFTFDTPGEYDLKCNIMCGSGHATMVSKLIVE